MKKRFFLTSILFTIIGISSFAQIHEPVKFKTEIKKLSTTQAEIIFTGTIEPGWHVYSTDLPSGGPISATFNVDKMEGATLDGKLKPIGKEIENFDKIFEMNLRYFGGTAKFSQKLKLTSPSFHVAGYLEYDAVTEVEFPESGSYHVYVRTYNWTSPWYS